MSSHSSFVPISEEIDEHPHVPYVFPRSFMSLDEVRDSLLKAGLTIDPDATLVSRSVICSGMSRYSPVPGELEPDDVAERACREFPLDKVGLLTLVQVVAPTNQFMGYGLTMLNYEKQLECSKTDAEREHYKSKISQMKRAWYVVRASPDVYIRVFMSPDDNVVLAFAL